MPILQGKLHKSLKGRVNNTYTSCKKISKHIYYIKATRKGIPYSYYQIMIMINKKRFQRITSSLEMAQIEEQNLLKLKEK